MYTRIINPNTGKKVNINSKLGKNILNNYIKLLGGSGLNKLEYQTKPNYTRELNRIDKLREHRIEFQKLKRELNRIDKLREHRIEFQKLKEEKKKIQKLKEEKKKIQKLKEEKKKIQKQKKIQKLKEEEKKNQKPIKEKKQIRPKIPDFYNYDVRTIGLNMNTTPFNKLSNIDKRRAMRRPTLKRVKKKVDPKTGVFYHIYQNNTSSM